MIAVEKTKVLPLYLHRCVAFQTKIESKNGSRDANKFVYKPTKRVTNSKVLAEALYRRCSHINGPFFTDTLSWMVE